MSASTKNSISRRRIIPIVFGVLGAPAALLAAATKHRMAPKPHVISWNMEDGSPMSCQDILECTEREWEQLKLGDPQYKFWVTHRLDSSTAGSDERLIAISPTRLAPEVQARADSVRRKRAERLRDKSASRRATDFA
jgi:hypothetical protein